MSDAVDYFRAFAVRALCKARDMPFGRSKRMQRAIGRVYHLLSREAALGPNLQHLDDFRAARNAEDALEGTSNQAFARPPAHQPRV
jgi:hypothetical protein